MATTQPCGRRIRRNSARVFSGSNQWKAWPAATKSAHASGSVVASAEPSTLTKPIRLQMQLARFAHLAIRLHAEDGVAVLQKELAQKARAGADVGDDVAGAKVTFLAQHVQQFGGVARPVAHVIGRAIGEALFGVGESHSRKLSLTSFQLSVKPWRRPTLRSSHHGNWRRKRTSFWKKTWMSSMPYLSMARRSMPMPKAKPLVFLAS